MTTAETKRARFTTGERMQRRLGMTGWYLLGVVLAAMGIGSGGGILGAWTGGGAVYAIMAREWPAGKARDQRVRRHVLTTLAAGAGLLAVDVATWASTGTTVVPWPLLPLVAVGAGAAYNARHAPPTSSERWPEPEKEGTAEAESGRESAKRRES